MSTGAARVSGVGTHRYLALAVLAASLFVVGVDMTVLNVVIPTLTRVLEPSRVQLLWIVDAYSLAVASVVVTCGNLGDRFGRKKVLLAGYVVFGVASIVAALADGPVVLIVARIGLGVGAALLMATTVALIRVIFTDDRERTRAIGWWSASHSVGAAAGPFIGGVLVEHLWWGSVFLINVPVVVVALVAGWRVIPEATEPNPRGVDPLSAVLSVVGVGALMYGLKEIGGYGVRPLAAVIGLVGVAVVTVFLRRQRRLAEPMINLSLFRDRRFALGAASILVGFGCAPAVLFLLTQKFQLVSNWSPLVAGLALIPWTLASGLGAVLGAWFAGRWGHRTTMAAGLGLFAVSSLVLAVLRNHPGYPVLVGALVGAGLGLGVALPLAGDNMMSTAEPRTAGQAGSIMQVCYELGAGTGIVVLGTLAGLVYRMLLPAQVPPGAAESLGGARAAADGLAGDAGAALLAAARAAFLSGYGVTTVVVAGLAAIVAGSVLVCLRQPART